MEPDVHTLFGGKDERTEDATKCRPNRNSRTAVSHVAVCRQLAQVSRSGSRPDAGDGPAGELERNGERSLEDSASRTGALLADHLGGSHLSGGARAGVDGDDGAPDEKAGGASRAAPGPLPPQ